MTALDLAKWYKKDDCVRILDLAMNSKERPTESKLRAMMDPVALILGPVKKGDLLGVQKALDANPDAVKAADKDGATALHHAVAGGIREIVELLLASGASVNAAKNDGVTALHIAAALGRTEIVKLLLEKGADRSLKDSSGRTALSLAKSKGYKDIVSLLTAESSAPPTPPEAPAQ